MYSDNLFKCKEDNNRDVLSSKDILLSSLYTLKKYVHKGYNKKLVLASRKGNKDEQYILKHEHYECACNEYMYSKICEKLGVQVNQVKLFFINDKKNKFETHFVSGSKYLSNSTSFSYLDINNQNIDNLDDYYKFIAMYYLLEEVDGLEIINSSNHIYRIDTTSSFHMSNFYIQNLLSNDNSDILMDSILNYVKNNAKHRQSYWNIKKEHFISKYGYDNLKYFMEVFNSFDDISYSDISNWLNTLTLIYPDVIGEYYNIYLKTLKDDVKKFIKK